jgi:acetyl-CoA acetyltransferase
VRKSTSYIHSYIHTYTYHIHAYIHTQLRDVRKGTKFPNDLKLEDTMWSGLNDQLIKMPMALTAEKLGEKFGITRQECDDVSV